MDPASNPATLARPTTAVLAVLAGVALLGNGMKAFVTSTVLVSESAFASFRGIPVARVALLMEAIIAGMVVALAAYPLLLRRMPPRGIGIAACAVAAAAFAAFGVVDLARPGAAQREWTAYLCLTIGAAADGWSFQAHKPECGKARRAGQASICCGNGLLRMLVVALSRRRRRQGGHARAGTSRPGVAHG